MSRPVGNADDNPQQFKPLPNLFVNHCQPIARRLDTYESYQVDYVDDPNPPTFAN